MNKLYKFSWDCGRNSRVEGMFIADENEVKEAIGEEIYFGSILGKYSEIHGILEEEDFNSIEVKQDTIEDLIRVVGNNVSGYNPLDYLEEDLKNEE